MANYELGKPPKKSATRDATHLAIVPVITAGVSYPGDHVGILKKQGDVLTVHTTFKPHIGIIDPFLPKHYPGLKTGTRVYLCLYPGSVTGLHHVYTHLALDGAPEVNSAKAWIESWCKAQGIGYDEMMTATAEWVECNRDKLTFDGHWSEGGRFEGQDLPEEFWDHYEKAAGVGVPEHAKHNFFSCSC